jgi:nitrate reductase gamma subunit
MDYLILTLLLIQILSGMWIAVFERWGSNWFAGVMSPYLWSLFKLNPEIGAVSAMPFAIKLHVVGAFIIFLVFPFTRLVHLLVAPLHYLFRIPQQVIWNRKPEAFKR